MAWTPMPQRLVRRLQAGEASKFAFAAAMVVLWSATWGARETGFVQGLVGSAWFWAALALIGRLLWPLLAVPRRGWAVREHHIRYRTGVLWQSTTTVPFNRVQH